MSSVYFRFRAPSVYLLLPFSAIFLFSVLFSFTLIHGIVEAEKMIEKLPTEWVHHGVFQFFGYISAAEQVSLRARWCV
jgi:hypothetical protein